MSMLPRLSLFEFHDQPWCPPFLKQAITDCVTSAWVFSGLWRNTVPHLADVLRRTQSQRIVDLCSGSGGPLPLAAAELRREFPELSTLLTDLYPKPQTLADLRPELRQRVEYRAEPVDALDVPPDLTGVRTLFGAFHHFPPPEAVRLLDSASRSGQPIAIFEFQRRDPFRNLLPPVSFAALSPLLAFALPRFRLWRLLFTVVPIIPVLWAWDSAASILRTYTPEELAGLATQAGRPGYRFEVREARSSFRGRITCLLGFPDPRGGVEVIRY